MKNDGAQDDAVDGDWIWADALPRPPRGPGEDDPGQDRPIGDPPDEDETDDPDDEDEGEEDEEPLNTGARAAFAR